MVTHEDTIKFEKDFSIIFRIPWGHNKLIIDKCKGNIDKALFYARKILENNCYTIQYQKNIIHREKLFYCHKVFFCYEAHSYSVAMSIRSIQEQKFLFLYRMKY